MAEPKLTIATDRADGTPADANARTRELGAEAAALARSAAADLSQWHAALGEECARHERAKADILERVKHAREQYESTVAGLARQHGLQGRFTFDPTTGVFESK